MRKFIIFIVENTHFTLLLALIILFYGLASLYQLNITQDPEIDFPQIDAFFFLQGASPSDLQKNVVFPIEAEIRGIRDIIDIQTTISHGSVHIWMKFKYGVDVVQKTREIESKINNIRRRLPEKLDFNVKALRISDIMSAFLLGIRSDGEHRDEQDNIALDLVNILEKVEHLKNISVVRSDEDIIVSLDLTKMRWLGISVDQVTNAIKSDNAFSSSGRLRINDKYFRFSGPDSRYEQFEDLKKTVVYSADGNPITLEAITSVYKRSQDDRIFSRYNSVDTAFVKIGVDSEVNILELKNKIAEAIKTFKATLPPTTQIDFIFDQSEGVRHLVFGLLENFAQGLVILFLVLLFSVGHRSTIIISSILPLSFLTAIFLFSFTGYGIQQVSIAGFIIALGLIVDNGIVVTENAFLLQNYQGYHRKDAAITGTSVAVSPLLSSTLTTMLAFSPIFMLTTDTAIYLRSMSVSIWLSLFASLFIAVTFVTVMLARIGTIGPLFGIPSPPSILVWLIPFRDRLYKTVLFYVVKWRFLTIFVGLLLLGYSLYLGSQLPIQVFPPTGDPYFTVNVTMPVGTDEPTKERVAHKIEEELKQFDAVESVATLISTKFPLFNVSMNNLGDLVILVKAKFGDEQRLNQLISELKVALRPLKVYADISLSLFQYKDLKYQSPFTLVVSGSEVNTLKAFAKKIDDSLRDIEGVDSVQNPMKSNQLNLRLEYIEDRANALGIAKSQIDLLLGMLTYGYEIDRFRDNRGQEFPILLKIEPDETNPLEILREIMIVGTKGDKIPLSEVISPSFEESESHITHSLFQPTVEIDFWLKEGFTDEEVAANVLNAVNRFDKPLGVLVEIGGALKKKQQDFQGIGKNALLIAALIFAIFVLQFKSFSQPLIIFSAVPLCLIGAIMGLVVTEQAMTFFAAVGITSLMGIVVNDSILLVDEGNNILKENPEKDVKEVAIEAGRKRFMPVLLTSLTTIAGLMPLALGSSPFKTMAIAIVGGLMSSTFLILFLVPALYSFLSKPKKA
ncbi:MAG: hypothetical protein DRR19_17320 [Candidatus Parabeggiatoa sp. nov. 1]|nr:MAG: hypothetical protein DRR19_17320 [Gammaproteobacteria bacterium]